MNARALAKKIAAKLEARRERDRARREEARREAARAARAHEKALAARRARYAELRAEEERAAKLRARNRAAAARDRALSKALDFPPPPLRPRKGETEKDARDRERRRAEGKALRGATRKPPPHDSRPLGRGTAPAQRGKASIEAAERARRSAASKLGWAKRRVKDAMRAPFEKFIRLREAGAGHGQIREAHAAWYATKSNARDVLEWEDYADAMGALCEEYGIDDADPYTDT